MAHHNKYWETKKAQEVEKNKYELKAKKKEKVVALATGLAIFAGLGGIVGYTKYSEAKEYETAQIEFFARKAPDYASMEASPSTKEDTTGTDGMIELDDFADLTVATATKGYDSLRDVLGDKIYLELINGFTTEYFHQSVEYDYSDFEHEVDAMIQEAELIGHLHGAYKTLEGEENLTEFTGCTVDDIDGMCTMKNFINNYTSGELRSHLEETHKKWESLVYFEREKQKVNSSYLDLFYQEEIINNLDYIDKYDVEFVILNYEQFMQEPEVIQEAYEKGYLPITRISNYSDITLRKNETLVPVKASLKNFPLYKDLTYYDEGFRDLAASTITRLFAEDVLDESDFLGGTNQVKDGQQIEGTVVNDLIDSLIQAKEEGKDISDITVKLETEKSDSSEATDESDGEVSTMDLEEAKDAGLLTDEMLEEIEAVEAQRAETESLVESVAESEVAEEEERDPFNLDMTQLENWQVSTLSLTGRAEEDVLFILWRVNRIEHTKNIPSMDDLYTELELKARTAYAQEKLGATIYAELNQMTDEEVEAYTDSLWGETHTHNTGSEGGDYFSTDSILNSLPEYVGEDTEATEKEDHSGHDHE